MINRNDLVKQFELVVQQEIKNHNESLLATNLSINEIRNQIAELTENLENRISVNSESITYHDVDLGKIKNELKSIHSKLDSHVNDTQTMNERNLRDQQILIEDFDKFINESENMQKNLIKLEDEQIKLRNLIKELGKSVSNEIEQWNKKLNDELKKNKQEILNMPSEAQAVKSDLENKLLSYKVDCEGLIKEVSVCKKTTFVIEKKIENLYTLIERLDKRIDS